MPTYTILIVDDCAHDREILRRNLLKGSLTDYRIVEAESGVDGWEAMDSVNPDCLLLDVNLPDFPGTDFLGSLTKQKGAQAPPVVLLTGQGSEDLAVQAMRLGAQDYLPKDRLQANQLHRSIQAAISRATHQRELERHHNHLEQAHRELQQVTSVLANDIKGFSESILGSISQRLSGGQDSSARSSSDPLEETQQSAKAMLSFVEDLLVFLKLANDPPSIKVEIDLPQLVQEISQNIQPFLSEQQAQLEITSLPQVWGYAEPLRHLFGHLIQNSLQFPGTEKLHIQIAGRAVGTNWQCSVRDNGKGMPLDSLNQLFSAFWQDAELSGSRTANGLGMALCKRVIDLHGGRIWAESQEGEGTVVHFTIPQKP